MKKIVYPILILLLAACGNTSTENTELDDLLEQRNELRTQYNELGTEISQLEKQIAKLDTTKRKTLVTVLPAKVDTFRHYFEVYGSVDVKRNSMLVAESPGNVQVILVDEGQTVRKGQSIIELDDKMIRKNIAEVQTSYDLAKTLYEKQERLWKENIGSEVQYLEAKNRKEGLENSLATLNEQLSKTTIRAPFSGVVDDISIKVGEFAGAGVPVARLLDLSDFHIEADVPESYASQLKEGNEVEVIFPGSDTLQAEITTIGRYINPANRTFRILVEVEGENGQFKPNQLTILRINDKTVPNAVILPANVIQQDATGNNFVYVAALSDEPFAVVEKTTVKMGSVYKGNAMVQSGLQGGEKIIDRGSRSIRDKQEVEITE